MSKNSNRTKANGEDKFTKTTYHDDQDIPRVVMLPPGETDATMGIPTSLDLTPLYGHLSADFQKRLYTALHARGLVEPADYVKPGAADRFRAAMLSAIKHDFTSVLALVQEELKHHG